jgi:gluconolactonase
MKLFLPLLFLLFFESAFSQLVKLNTSIKFQFVEGPVWDGKGALYFSDMNAKKVYKYVPETGFSVIRNGQITNGMAFDSTGYLIVCEQGPTNELVRMDTLGIVKKVLVNRYNSKPFNNPNDLCIDQKGGIYFSDPTWGTQTQDKQAIYYLKPSGECIRISGDFQKPNGNCLSPDGKLLYVDDSNDKNVSVFDVQPDGTAINKRVFCVLKVNTGAVSGADGMKVDSEGTLYIASAVGIQVFDKNGTSKKIISVPETSTNVAFGGNDWKTLFITAGRGLYSMQVDVAGIPIYTSVNQLQSNKLDVYPNPTNGLLSITSGRYKSIKVFNISGQEVISEPNGTGPKTIDLSFLQNGYYVVKVENEKSNRTAKVLLQK